MTAVLSPADVSANVAPVPVEQAPKTKGRVAHRAPGSSILLDVQAVAEMLGCSQRHIYRLADAGRMPAPVKLGALVRWNRSAVESWVNQGCPSCRRAGR